jgi:uncharacterized protein (DUF2235 family)
MKRIAILIDGTWNKEGEGADTNVAKLDAGKQIVTASLIKPTAAGEIPQTVHYHDGVGSDGPWIQRILGGALGFGLKKIVQEAYEALANDYKPGDEIYIFGFSRGAYAARALAGLIGASGIQRQRNSQSFEIAWSHYRVSPEVRSGRQPVGASDKATITNYQSSVGAFHQDTPIKCIGVWDTVGSYGVPAGIGFLAPLARFITLFFLGFHDTRFGNHIDVGLHAVAIDEHRRPFVPTFWTIPKGQQPKGHVEQTWFAGAHANVGGSYADSGLSDRALIWMIARVQALTGLEFDTDAVRATTRPNIDGDVMDSTSGFWLLDHWLPHYRVMLSPDAIEHGYLSNSPNPLEQHINERIHWSPVEKRDRKCTVYGIPNTPYNPPNYPEKVPPDKVATVTPEEQRISAS